MTGTLNKAQIIGNVGRDPEIRVTQSGSKIAALSVATSESWKDKHSGERQERVSWHRVVIFSEALADIAERYVRKGSKIYLEGQIETRKWTDQSGQEKFTTEIVLRPYRGTLTLLDKRDGDGGAPQQRATQGHDLDDSIPF